MSRRLGISLAVGSLLLAGGATADEYYFFRPEIYGVLGADRETGVKIGRGRFHLALGTLNSYDSNALYSDADPRGDWVFQLIPGGDFVWNSRRLQVMTGYRYTKRYDWNEAVQDFQAHTANLEAKYRFSRRISGAVKERFESTDDPAYLTLLERLGRYTNEASGEVTYRTPGEDFETTVRYTNTYQKLRAPEIPVRFLTQKVSLTSKINVSSRFRFLPKSVAIVTLEYGQTGFRDDPNAVFFSHDSRGFNGSVGLTSQVTRKLSLSGDIGGSSIFFEGGPDSHGITGGASAMYRPSPRSSLTAGYRRTVQIASFTNYYNVHHSFFEATWKFARKFEYAFRSHFDLLDYSGPNVFSAGGDRSDFVVRLLSGVSYSFKEWCKARVEYQLDYRASNATDQTLGVANATFTKHRMNLGIDFYY